MVRPNNHPLPNLPVLWRLFLSGAVLLGWALFLSAWLASVIVSGWGFSFSALIHLGQGLEDLRQTSPASFPVLFAAHALSLPMIIGITARLVLRMALPRGFRAALIGTAVFLGVLDLALWGLLAVSPFARLVLAPELLLETVVLLVLVLLPMKEMWVFTRWKGSGQTPGRPQRVVIVGGGFGGLYTAMGLDAQLGYHKDLEIVLLDKKNYFLFPPLLPSVATGAIESRQVTYPFRRVFEATNIVFKKESVERIDLEIRKVYTRVALGPDPVTQQLRTVTRELEYDYLVLAPGSNTNTFRVPGADEHAFYMRELGDAIAVRNHIIDCFEHAAGERDATSLSDRLRFVVVGAGPTGVELAAEMQDLIQHILLRRYPEVDRDKIEVVLVQSGDQVLPGWHPEMAGQTAKQLAKLRVKVVLGTRVVSVGPASVTLATGEVIGTQTVVWCTGVKPADVVAASGLVCNKAGQVPVGADMRVAGLDRVFVLGDVAECLSKATGKALPALAQVALQQGTQTGPNLVRLLKGKPTRPFKYLDYGALICVGEHHAVVNLMGLRLSGFIAWFIWRTLYLAKLVGIGNRIRVVLDWTLDLLVERSISQIWTGRREVQSGAKLE